MEKKMKRNKIDTIFYILVSITTILAGIIATIALYTLIK